MKTHVKLLVLAMVLVMFTFCLAACGGGEGDGTTTTTAPVTTTTAPPVITTTAPVAGGYDPADFVVTVDEEIPYSGIALDVLDVTTPSNVEYNIKYASVDADGNVIQELGNEKPVNCGAYMVTVTFSWRKPDKTDPLPAAISKFFSVVPVSLADHADNFGAKNIEILYKTNGMSFDPLDTDSALVTGDVPTGIVCNASVVKLENANDTGAGTPVAEAGKITTADGAGYFRVTVTYTEPTGHDNFTDENTISHSAVVYARAINKIVGKVANNGITVDGTIDTVYGEPLFVTEYQPYITKLNSKGDEVFDKIDATQLVDPYTKAAALYIYKGAKVTAAMQQNAASAKFYAAWDGAYIYIAIEVTDTTHCERSANYTAQPDPWINDNFELYYLFGGDSIPDMSNINQTSPTYKAVVRDSSTGEQGFTGTVAQKSHYFNDIICKVDGRADAADHTYVIEYKFPAKSETYTGTASGYGTNALTTYEGSPLEAGDFIFLLYQLNDLMGVPYKRLADDGVTFDPLKGTLSETERWDSYEDYDANIDGVTLPTQKSLVAGSPWRNFENDASPYIYSSGNRGNYYIQQPGCLPMILQLGE